MDSTRPTPEEAPAQSGGLQRMRGEGDAGYVQWLSPMERATEERQSEGCWTFLKQGCCLQLAQDEFVLFGAQLPFTKASLNFQEGNSLGIFQPGRRTSGAHSGFGPVSPADGEKGLSFPLG